VSKDGVHLPVFHPRTWVDIVADPTIVTHDRRGRRMPDAGLSFSRHLVRL